MNERAERSPLHYAIGKKNPNLPFHPAVRAGDFIFVSGQVPKDENNNMISGTIEEETLAHHRRPSSASSPQEGATLPTSCASPPISRIPATSGATTRRFCRASAMRCWPAPPSRRSAVINTKIEMDAIVYKPLAKA